MWVSVWTDELIERIKAYVNHNDYSVSTQSGDLIFRIDSDKAYVSKGYYNLKDLSPSSLIVKINKSIAWMNHYPVTLTNG